MGDAAYLKDLLAKSAEALATPTPEERIAELTEALGRMVNACIRYDEWPDSDVAIANYHEAMEQARRALADK